MVIKKFEIQILNNPSSTYYPGQVVEGQLHVTATKECTHKGIVMMFKGGAHLTSNESQFMSFGKTQTAKEEYLDMSYDLLGTTGIVTKKLADGSYTFPFSCQLPTNIPASLKPHISYEMTAIMDKVPKSNVKTSIPFTVLGTLDLNKEEDLWKEALKPIRVTKANGPIALSLTVSRTGFVPGDQIFFILELMNQSKSHLVHETLIQLVQKTTLYYNKGSADNAKTKIIEKVTSKVKGPSVWPGKTETMTGETAFINVPMDLPPSGLPCSNIIDIDYHLQVELCTLGGQNVLAKAPIIIGSVALAMLSANMCPPPATASTSVNLPTTLSLPPGLNLPSSVNLPNLANIFSSVGGGHPIRMASGFDPI